jgi:NADH-quinone oxidoreductase subunit J
MLFCSFLYILIVSSVFVILADNIVFSLIFLVSSFASAAILLIRLEAEFLTLIYLVIYIAILFFSSVDGNRTNCNNPPSLTSSAPVGAIFKLLLFLLILVAFNLFNEFKPGSFQNPFVCIIELSESNIEISISGSLLYFDYSINPLRTGLLLLVTILGIFRLTNFSSTKTNSSSLLREGGGLIPLFIL